MNIFLLSVDFYGEIASELFVCIQAEVKIFSVFLFNLLKSFSPNKFFFLFLLYLAFLPLLKQNFYLGLSVLIASRLLI